MSSIERILLLTALLPMWLGGNAQEITFKASVDRNSIATGEHVRLTISVSNASERFEMPDLGGLIVVQGPFENSSFNYVNGRMSSSVTRTWVLTATSPGTYKIGPARMRVGNGTIQTEAISIEVTKGAARPPDPAVAQGQRGDPNLFGSINLSQNKGYVGDQIIATYTLYSRYSTLEPVKYDFPKLNGFWSEEIEMGEVGWQDQLTTINGVQYRVAILKRQLLFPQRGGKLRIEPAKLSFLVNRSFFNRGTQVDVMTNAVEFTAMALPGGAPAGFSGTVGQLELDVITDRTELRSDEAVEIRLRLTGRSNLKLIEPPRLELPSDFESYDPKVVDKINLNSSGMSGSREFQYTVIPRHDGHFDLGPITYSYFDTKTGTYRTLVSPPLVFDVAPGSGGTAAQVQRPLKSDVVTLDEDVRYIRTGDLELRPKGRFLFGSAPWIAGMAAPAIAFVGLLFWHRKREHNLSDVEGTRRRRAEQTARKRLQEAEQAMKQGTREPFYATLSKAMHGYLSDKFGLGVAEVNLADLHQRFEAIQDGAELATACTRLLTACDMARFAPVEDRPRGELYEEAVNLIQRIEQSKRS